MINVETRTAFSLFDIQGGMQPPKSEFEYSPRPGFVRFVQIRDFESDAHPTFIQDDGSWRYCNELDTLIGRYGAAVGRICRGLSGAYNVALVKVIPREGVHPDYLHYLLRSDYFQGPLLAASGRSAQAGFNKDDLRVINLPFLPGKDQARVAQVLRALDDKIELNRRMNETLEAMAQAIFCDWFVDFGPVRRKLAGAADPVEIMGGVTDDCSLAATLAGLFPVGLDDSELPLGWKVSTVGSSFDLTMGQSPPGETYNESGEGLPFFQGRTDFGFRFPVRRKYCSQPSRVAQPDDTLISVRAPVGDLNMAWETCCIGRGVAAARHKSGGPSYTYYAMQALQPELEQFEHTGTVFGAINKQQFERLAVVEPDRRLVSAFEDLAGPIDARIRSSVSETGTLAATRDYLLPRLMSGEVRVAEAEERLEAVA